MCLSVNPRKILMFEVFRSEKWVAIESLLNKSGHETSY